jgi:hypothetical protein
MSFTSQSVSLTCGSGLFLSVEVGVLTALSACNEALLACNEAKYTSFASK